MLKLIVSSEWFDDDKQEFIDEKIELELEHSLVSMSKWESRFEKPFLHTTEKTTEEAMAYIEMMILTPDYPPDVLQKLSQENLNQVSEYINRKMTATWFNEPKHTPPSREKITSELIYFWMVSYQIPWEAQHWHISRLFTLIKIFNAKNTKQKPKSRAEMIAERNALNEQRKAQLKTRG